MPHRVIDIRQESLQTVSRGHNPKNTIKIGNSTYYVKYDAPADKQINGQKRVAEDFVAFLGKRMGFRCVDGFTADINITNDRGGGTTHQTGFVSKSYKNPDVVASFTLLDVIRPEDEVAAHFTNYDKTYCSIEKTLRDLPTYIKKKSELFAQAHPDQPNPFDNLCATAELKDELVTHVLVDYVLGNDDRHTENIEFLITKTENGYELQLAPMFDNGRALGLYRDKEKFLQSQDREFMRELFTDRWCDHRYTIEDIDQRPDHSFNALAQEIPRYFSQIAQTDDGFDYTKLASDPNYILYSKFKEMNLEVELLRYLCDSANMELPEDKKQLKITPEILEKYRQTTGVSLEQYNIDEAVANFNSRRGHLVEYMQPLDEQFEQAKKMAAQGD